MTLHISYDHECPECGASYVPYGKEVCCPRCGLFEQERFETFIQLTTKSALYNFQYRRRFTPIAWAACSLGDTLLYFLFTLLDSYLEKMDGNTVETFSEKYVASADFNGTEYLREYVVILACEVQKNVWKDEMISNFIGQKKS